VAKIEVRCHCGRLYHADPAHAGRSIRCRCGRAVPIPTPNPSARSRFKWPTLRFQVRLPPWVPKALTFCAWTYLAGALLSALGLWLLGDVWWPFTVLLFGPRWLLLVPAAPLALAAALLRPRLLLPVLVGLALVLGPVMGYRIGWRGWVGGEAPGTLRVITFNVDGGANPRAAEIPAELAKLEPDVVVLQECPEALAVSGAGWQGWTIRRDRSLCLASRFPVDSVLTLETVETRSEGMTGMGFLYWLRTPAGVVRLGNIHLETPRKGLEPLRGTGEVANLVRNIMLRDVGSRRVSRWLAGQQADIVAGDFNLTVESVIYRRYWSECPDAFSRVGRGFGWTRVLLRFAARIDHVLACGSWRPVSARVGPDLGSDHLPLIVDLVPIRGQ